jgi:hypothetical protein
LSPLIVWKIGTASHGNTVLLRNDISVLRIFGAAEAADNIQKLRDGKQLLLVVAALWMLHSGHQYEEEVDRLRFLTYCLRCWLRSFSGKGPL